MTAATIPKETNHVPVVKAGMMKALAYRGPDKTALEDHVRPDLSAPTDAIVRITKTTICGTDLHILKSDVPSCKHGRILGHEGVGVIDQVGPAATAFKPGDRVLISCITSCGKCEYCRRGTYSHCTTGGWILVARCSPGISHAANGSPAGSIPA